MAIAIGAAIGFDTSPSSRPLSGRFLGEGTLSGTLAPVARELSGAFSGEGTLAGSITTPKYLSGAFLGEGTLTGIISSAYTPTQDPDLLIWGDAQADVTTSGGELTAWADQLSAQSLDPPTVTARPLYGTDQINGLDVLTFRGADPNYLLIDSTGWGSNITLYFVIQSNTSTPNILLCNSSNNSNFIQKANNNSNPAALGLGSGLEYYINGVSIGTDINQIELDSAITSNCLLTITGVDLTGINSVFIGVRSDLVRGLDGKIGDFAADQGGTKLTENNNYFIDKYGF